MTLSARYSFDAIGTRWSIDTQRALTADDIARIEAVVTEFDSVYSRFRSDSLVSRARAAGSHSVAFPDSVIPLLTTYESLYGLSKGRINPLVGDSLERLGYDQDYSFIERGHTPAPPLDTTVNRHGSVLTFTQAALLDIGAIGKGYLVDRLRDVLAPTHTHYVIDGSGDIAVHTVEPEIIGLEHPSQLDRVIGTVRLRQGSLCASAPNRRAWGKGLHHIIDATTGGPVETTIAATWAVAGSTMLADALTTGLFFVSPDELQREFGDFRYVIMNHDAGVQHNLSEDIGEIFT